MYDNFSYTGTSFLDCPTGWFLYAGYCYSLSARSRYFHTDTWFLDRWDCGRSRVSITSSHEHAFLLTLLADFDSKDQLGGRDVWIGIKREYGNQFRWINGDELRYETALPRIC